MDIIDLEDVSRFVVKASVYDETMDYVRAAGHRGVECLVIWAGLPKLECFAVDTVICPYQTATAFRSRISSRHVDQMYEHLYRNGRIAVAQVHSHPGEAYHSDTDDEYSIVTRFGALSLVIPNFGFGVSNDIERWAGFRLRSAGWEEIVPNELVILEGRSL